MLQKKVLPFVVFLFILFSCLSFYRVAFSESKKPAKPEKPSIKKEDVDKPEAMVPFVNWFMQNDPYVYFGPGDEIIFSEGIRPKVTVGRDPAEYKDLIKNLDDWFFTKVFLDMQQLADTPKTDFEKFMDKLSNDCDAQAYTLMDIGKPYKVDFKNFVYDQEVKKIPEGKSKKRFKTAFLQNHTTCGELRIISWAYYNWYEQMYEGPKK